MELDDRAVAVVALHTRLLPPPRPLEHVLQNVDAIPHSKWVPMAAHSSRGPWHYYCCYYSCCPTLVADAKSWRNPGTRATNARPDSVRPFPNTTRILKSVPTASRDDVATLPSLGSAFLPIPSGRAAVVVVVVVAKRRDEWLLPFGVPIESTTTMMMQ